MPGLLGLPVDLLGLGFRSLPAISVSHRVGPIQHDDHLSRTERRADRHGGVLQEGTRERGHEKDQREGSDRQQCPMMDLPALARPKRNLPEEHQRREVHDVLPLPFGEMNDDGHCQTQEAQQE